MHKRNQGNIFFACEKIQKLFFKKNPNDTRSQNQNRSQRPKPRYNPAIFISVSIPLIFYFFIGEKDPHIRVLTAFLRVFGIKYAEKLSSITGASWGVVRGAFRARIGKQSPN